MLFRKWAAPALFGASLCLAGVMAAALLAPCLASAQSYPSRTLIIASPVNGASITNPVTVSISLSNSGTGSGGNPPMAAGHHHGGHAYLVVDSPEPAAGDAITADPKHIAFPAGQRQLSVSLPAGKHQLQVVFANRKGEVSSHVQPSAPITVTIQ